MTEKNLIGLVPKENCDFYAKHGDNKNICNCPYSEIEYLITVENVEAINIKTGKCLRCMGERKNSLGITLKGKRKYKTK